MTEMDSHGRRPASPDERPQARVSVVIPTYNRSDYLVPALESVFAQTFVPDEVFVVDDGSTDETPAVLRSYRHRIIALSQPNSGAAAARNRGIALARGEWVAFLDSDDMWEPEALESLVRAIPDFPDAGLITFRGRVVTSDGKRTGKILGKQSPGPDFTSESFLREDSGGVLTPMVRRAVLLEAGGYDESIRTAHDCDLWLRLTFRTRMVSLSEPLLLRRVHDDNASGDQLLNARMWLRILDKLAKEQPEFVRRRRDLYQRSLAKEHIRLGREALARCRGDREMLAEARRNLRLGLKYRPRSRRAWSYLLWSYVFPSSYGAWRRRERRSFPSRV
jgi:glycosyltransferase involved in cell wall biosynthesis